jgi:hypothetical protein
VTTAHAAFGDKSTPVGRARVDGTQTPNTRGNIRETTQVSHLSKKPVCCFGVESHPKYENVNPGTVTVEGFGIEACDLDSARYPREPVTLDYDRTIEPTTQGRVARRLDELQRNTREFSWDSAKDRAALADFIDLKDGGGKGLLMSRLCCFLNSPDQFFDLRVMAIVEMWTSEPNSVLPIMWQVVLGKESCFGAWNTAPN